MKITGGNKAKIKKQRAWFKSKGYYVGRLIQVKVSSKTREAWKKMGVPASERKVRKIYSFYLGKKRQ